MSAEQTAALDFDGYGIGGLSVGETRAEMLPALAAAIEQLPADRPRYLMGVGDPASLVESIALGVDQFDCVLQTRLGRHGTALTSTGKVQVKAARHGDEDVPVDARCSLRGVRPPQPWLPAPSVQRRRTVGRPPAHPAQRRLDAAADGAPPARRSPSSASPSSVTTCCVCGDEHR